MSFYNLFNFYNNNNNRTKDVNDKLTAEDYVNLRLINLEIQTRE